MASVDPLDGAQGNKAFAETHKADFPLLSDPTKETAKAYGVLRRARVRQSLDVLHRQGRPHPGDRQGRGQASGDVGRRHGRQARRTQDADGDGEESRHLRQPGWVLRSVLRFGCHPSAGSASAPSPRNRPSTPGTRSRSRNSQAPSRAGTCTPPPRLASRASITGSITTSTPIT